MFSGRSRPRGIGDERAGQDTHGRIRNMLSWVSGCSSALTAAATCFSFESPPLDTSFTTFSCSVWVGSRPISCAIGLEIWLLASIPWTAGRGS
jgi:hypothetical protein